MRRNERSCTHKRVPYKEFAIAAQFARRRINCGKSDEIINTIFSLAGSMDGRGNFIWFHMIRSGVSIQLCDWNGEVPTGRLSSHSQD